MDIICSIVVPLYNYAHFLGDLIDSVLKQDYGFWELIIIDDFSNDNPEKIIDKYCDKRISIYRLNKNRGYSVAKNEGIIKSRGKHIIVLDADDMLYQNSLSSRIEFLDNHDEFKWMHAKAYEFSGSKPYKFVFKKRRSIKLLRKILKTRNYSQIYKAIHAQTVMVKREVYEKVGLYEESMRSMSDKEMWARIYNNIGRPGYLNKFVACYRIHSKQMHKSKNKIKNLAELQNRLKYFISKRKQGNKEGIRCL